MSQTLNYSEPYRVPAGLLALAVHVAFIGLLMLGVRWQSYPPEDFSVELWDSLPVAESPPEQILVADVLPVPTVETKVETPQAISADIELRQKKVAKAEPVKPTQQEIKAKREAEERQMLEEYAEKRRQSEQARVRAEINAATAAEVGRYQDMIRSKIRRNIVMPPDVPESAVSEFKVTLLPGGMVMDAILLKSSGNAAYDNAAERAIYKAQPLPLPTDAGLQKLFRELRLTIRP
jgi:colicin import membrane protein